MKALRDKIIARIEECERTGNILDVSGLHTALALLDETMKQVSDDQSAKADAGKARLTLVPQRILWDIAAVRAYGNHKYPEGGPDNWKRVEPQRYMDAAYRHMSAYVQDPGGVDEESGLPHLWHLACNIAFLCEMEGKT